MPEVEFPEKLAFLFEPAPYKIAYSGRDGMKSWGFARALLLIGAQGKLRVLCARETQQSIAESVHHLLEQQIIELGLTDCYRVEQKRIIGTITHRFGMYGDKLDHAGNTEFVFAGLRHNVTEVKSLEGIDVAWVEEAANVSKHSWEVVLPTIRKKGSEIWVSFNPEFDADDTYVRWVLKPPPGARVVKTSWRDNKWLSESSRIKIEHMRQTDPEGFRHIYEGQTRSSVQGAVFGKELESALAERRIGLFPRDRTKPVETAWDLGYGDKTAIWFWQAVDGWYRLIDYLEDKGKPIEWYLIQLQNKGYLYGVDWLPHDAVDTIIHQKLASNVQGKSIEMILREAGRNVRISPKLFIHDQVNLARTVFPQCQFDAENCAEGLRQLRLYQWGPPNLNGVTGTKPLHNEASHGGSAFQTFAVCAKQPKKVMPAGGQKQPARPVSAWT